MGEGRRTTEGILLPTQLALRRKGRSHRGTQGFSPHLSQILISGDVILISGGVELGVLLIISIPGGVIHKISSVAHIISKTC